MTLDTAKSLAESLMAEHGLTAWRFRFDRATGRFGLCDGRQRLIQLSGPVVAVNTDARVRETILHEIAHALVGCEHGHDYTWASKARAIGLENPQRCGTAANTAMPELAWQAVCPTCGRTAQYARQPKRVKACGVCCNAFNHGRFSTAHVLTFYRQPIG